MQCTQAPESPLVTHKWQHLKVNPLNNKSDTELSLGNNGNNPGNCAVYIHNLCKEYDSGPPIIENLCMNVDRGTIYGLLGSSGCGKTTILSCIVGLAKWNSGEVLVFGKKPGSKESGIPGKRLGYMPQDISLYSALTIQEIILFYGRIYNMSGTDVGERLEILNNLLELPNNSQQIRELSGGQKRRASLALALLHSPELLVLDEPTVGLDPLLRIKIWDHLYEMVNVLGSTIIVTTHYIEEARFANKIGLVRRGRMLVEDTPARLLQIYQLDLLEQVIQQLCRKDETNLINVSSQNSNNADTKIGNEDLFRSKWKQTTITSIVATKGKHEIVDGSYRKSAVFDSGKCAYQISQKQSQDNDADGCVARIQQNWQRIHGMTSVILTALTRYPLFLILILLLPTTKAIVSILILGTMPRGTQIGIVNNEVVNWKNECAFLTNSGNTCDLTFLSCKFLQQLQTGNVVVLQSYSTEEAALAQVHYGKIMAYLTIPENYSQNSIDFAIARQFALNGSIEGSRIHAHLDYSQYISTIFAIRHVMGSYLQYINKLALSCHLDGLETEIPPLKFRQTIYGNTDENYTDYIMPGIILTGLVTVSSALTALTLIYDRKEGNMSRALVAGLAPSDVMISHLIIEGIIIVIQMLILEIVLHFIFGFRILGSLWLCLFMCLLTGVCGTLIGIFLAIICSDEVEVVVIEIFLYPFLMFFGGVIWPTEIIVKYWRYVGYVIPSTVISMSLRSVTVRGLGLMHPLVWPGCVVLIVWILVSTICCMVAYKIFCK